MACLAQPQLQEICGVLGAPHIYLWIFLELELEL
jgi:hypothetical protein